MPSGSQPGCFLIDYCNVRGDGGSRGSGVRTDSRRRGPTNCAAIELAHADDLDAALEAFAGDDPVSRYNRWVISPDRDDAASRACGRCPTLWRRSSTWSATRSASSTCPTYDVAGLPGEIAALVLATQATAALEHGDVDAAVELLLEASSAAGEESPALAAVLLGNAGTLLREHDSAERARTDPGRGSDRADRHRLG